MDQQLTMQLRIGYVLLVLEALYFLYWIAATIVVLVLDPLVRLELLLGLLHFVAIFLGMLAAIGDIRDVLSTPEDDRVHPKFAIFWTASFTFSLIFDVTSTITIVRAQTFEHEKLIENDTVFVVILVLSAIGVVLSALALVWGIVLYSIVSKKPTSNASKSSIARRANEMAPASNFALNVEL